MELLDICKQAKKIAPKIGILDTNTKNQTLLTVADFLSLRMQYKAEQAENEIPAVIEHNFKDGRMVDHYFVVPGPALLADEAVQDFGGKIENILFLQQREPGAPW